MADYIKGEGNIFKNDYKKLDSHPDNKGKIRIPKDLLKLMAEEFKTSNASEIEMDLALWNRVAKKTGKNYQFARLEMPYKKPNVEQAKEVVENAVASELSDEPPF